MSFNKNTKLFEGYIYKIDNGINNKIYIGQTSSKINLRWNQHKSAARTKAYSLPLYNAMNKYGIEKFSIHVIEKYYANTKEDLLNILNEKEIYYISKYNTLRPNGYNVSSGGDNFSHLNIIPVDAYYANGTLFKRFSSQIDAKEYLNRPSASISKCCKGKAFSASGYVWRYKDEPFEKYNINVTQEQLDRDNNKIPVDVYTLEGVFVDSYDCIKKALEGLCNRSEGTSFVKKVCDGIYNQAYGYVFRYLGEPFDKYEYKTNAVYKPVDLYTLNGDFIGTYPTIAQAARENNISNRSHLSDCCNGKRKYVENFVCRYTGEPFDKYLLERKKSGTIPKKVNQYSLTNEYLKTYCSSKDAYNETKVYFTSILKTCRGTQKTAGGYKWFYADDPNQPDRTKIIS